MSFDWVLGRPEDCEYTLSGYWTEQGYYAVPVAKLPKHRETRRLLHGLNNGNTAKQVVLSAENQIAIHEAGHAVVAHRLGARVTSIHCRPDSGLTCAVLGSDPLTRVAYFYAGIAAENAILGSRGFDCALDEHDARGVAQSAKGRPDLIAKGRALAFLTARKHRSDIERLARALATDGHLTGPEILKHMR